MGTDAAMMVTEDSAAPQMMRGMPSTAMVSGCLLIDERNGVRTDISRIHCGDVCNLDERGHSSAANRSALVQVWAGGLPYKTPMLMAMHTPIFSAFFICSDHSSFHGKKAKTRSIAAEYATGRCQ